MLKWLLKLVKAPSMLEDCQNFLEFYRTEAKKSKARIESLNDECNKKTEKIFNLELMLKESTKPVDVPSANVTYRRPVIIAKNEVIQVETDVRNFIMPDFEIKDSLKKKGLVYDGTQDLNALIPKIYRHAKTNYKYGPDADYGLSEYVMFPFELRAMLERKKSGDCVAFYEEIYTKTGIKRMDELAEGDEVLSYDFSENKFVVKPITKIWKKGKLKAKRVYLRNGKTIDITEDHNLLFRTNQYGKSKYKKTRLKDMNLINWWKRKMPTAKKIPYEVIDTAWLTENKCFIIGHFIAEGWMENSHVCTSGYDCPEIASLLEEENIPFSEGKNGCGVPIINFLKSDFKKYLQKIKTNSFDIRLPEEIFHLPEKKLRAFLAGEFLGDGNFRGGYAGSPTITKDYSTSSKQLADDLQRIHLQLGEPIYTYKQECHQGVGNKPIFRLRLNPASTFNRNHGYTDLSETSISWIEDMEETDMIDIEVKDTNNFVFKNGLISHNCDDWSNMIGSHLAAAGIPRDKWLVSYGIARAGFGHATIYAKDNGGNWRHLNSTKPESDAKKLPGFPSNKDNKDSAGIKEDGFWFSYNDLFSIHEWESEEAKASFKAAKIPVDIRRNP